MDDDMSPHSCNYALLSIWGRLREEVGIAPGCGEEGSQAVDGGSFVSVESYAIACLPLRGFHELERG